jgi:hypothetical protein
MGWVATLSNGEIRKESEPKPGERTPWQKLLQYCRENDVKLTSLRLRVGSTTVHAMPQKMCNGYFQAYEAERILWRDKIKHKQGIGSIINDEVHITWIDLATNDVYQEIRPLSEVKIHTTIE